MVTPANSGANIRTFFQGDGLRIAFNFIYQKGSRVIKLAVATFENLA